MKPEQKRVLIHATLTALTLAAIGSTFVHFAGTFLQAPDVRPESVDLNPVLPDGAEFRVPLMMALWGFVFVIVGELVLARFRRRKLAPPPQAAPATDVTKVLNELLARAEAERAAKPPTDPPVS